MSQGKTRHSRARRHRSCAKRARWHYVPGKGLMADDMYALKTDTATMLAELGRLVDRLQVLRVHEPNAPNANFSSRFDSLVYLALTHLSTARAYINSLDTYRKGLQK